jgi:hypothetical protein
MKEEFVGRYIEGIVVIIVGFVLLLILNSIGIPSEYNTFLGIPYEYNPTYAMVFFEKIMLFIVGLIGIAAGPSVIATRSFLQKREKKTDFSQIS